MRRANGSAALGLLDLQIATVMLATAGVLSSVVPIPVTAVTGIRALLAIPFLLLVLIVQRRSVRLSMPDRSWLIVLSGVLLALHWVTYFHSIRLSSVATGTFAAFTFPVMTAVIEPVVFREKCRGYTLVNALLVLIGMVLVSNVLSSQSSTVEAVLWGLLSAGLYTGRNLISRKSAKKGNAQLVMTIQLLVVVLVLSFSFGSVPWSSLNLRHWGTLLSLGLLSTAVGHTLFLRSLHLIGAATASIGVSLQPVYAALLAFALLGETTSASTIAGGAAIVVAVLHESIRTTLRQRSNDREGAVPPK